MTKYLNLWKYASGGHLPELETSVPPSEELAHKLIDLVPVIRHLYTNCPELGCPYQQEHDHILWQVVTHLNDTHEWTREKISDWLEEFSRELGTSFQILGNSSRDEFMELAVECDYCHQSTTVRDLFVHIVETCPGFLFGRGKEESKRVNSMVAREWNRFLEER